MMVCVTYVNCFFKRRYFRQAKDADRPGPKWQEVWIECSSVALRDL
jgi:hypothetical protein